MGILVRGVLLSEGASATQTGLRRGASGLVPGLAVCAGAGRASGQETSELAGARERDSRCWPLMWVGSSLTRL